MNISLYGKVTHKLEGIRKEVAVSYLEILS
jgi:hypothetical protein